MQSVVTALEAADISSNAEAKERITVLEGELAQHQRENTTLRSELEVMEGENSRRTTDLDILESENTRLRTDMDAVTQSTQILEAEKESLVMETQRLEREKQDLKNETLQYSEGSAQASEQVRLLHEQLMMSQQQTVTSQQHIAALEQQLTATQQQAMLQQQAIQPVAVQETVEMQQMAEVGAEDEVDWGSEGSKEVEHVQRSSSHDPSLQEEVRTLKEQLIAVEKERNALADDLQAAKIKSGKLLQKMKALQSSNETLQKDISKLKNKGGLSDLDLALEEEYKSQVSKAHSERDELKQKLEDVVKEKDHVSRQSEVLKDGHDRLIEMKEDQETQIRVLRSRNEVLETSVNSLEWKVSELEEVVEEERKRSGGAGSGIHSLPPVAVDNSGDSKQLSDQIIALEAQLDELSSSNMKIESLNKDLNERLVELEAENERLLLTKETLEGENTQLKESNTKANKDVGVYKEAFIEQQDQFEKLTDEKTTLSNDLDATDYQLRTLKSAYNALFMEQEELKKDGASFK